MRYAFFFSIPNITLLVGALISTPVFAQQNPALGALLEQAKASHSDTLLVMQNDQVLLNWHSGDQAPETIELMSALKSVVAIAVGHLLAEGKLESLDQLVHTIYPEWRQGRKQAITIRHLLAHTSGIQNVANAGVEIYPSPDALALALAAEIEDPPGTVFSYNNKAVNLLAGIIEKASGTRMDLFIEKALFEPLDITTFKWFFDPSGRPHAMAGLELKAVDLAKFGQLLLKMDSGRADAC